MPSSGIAGSYGGGRQILNHWATRKSLSFFSSTGVPALFQDLTRVLVTLLVSPLTALSPQPLTALNLFLPFFPISAPSLLLGVHLTYPCYATSTSFSGTPRWLCIIFPACFLPLLFQLLVFSPRAPTLWMPSFQLLNPQHCCSASYHWLRIPLPTLLSCPFRSCFYYFFYKTDFQGSISVMLLSLCRIPSHHLYSHWFPSSCSAVFLCPSVSDSPTPSCLHISRDATE